MPIQFTGAAGAHSINPINSNVGVANQRVESRQIFDAIDVIVARAGAIGDIEDSIEVIGNRIEAAIDQIQRIENRRWEILETDWGQQYDDFSELAHINARRRIIESECNDLRALVIKLQPEAAAARHERIDAAVKDTLEKLLAESSVDLSGRNGDGDTLLLYAVKAGIPQMSSALLNSSQGQRIDVGEANDKSGETAIAIAVDNGSWEVADILLARGAHVDDAADKKLGLALHEAVRGGHVNVVDASINAKERQVNSALKDLGTHQSLSEEERLALFHQRMREAMDEVGAKKTPLTDAILNGCMPIVQALLKAGASVDKSDGSGCTPLILAAKQGRLDMVSELLEADKAKASINMEDREGNTALIFSAQRGQLVMVNVLLAAGAKANHASNNDDTALLWAVKGGWLDVVKVLMPNASLDRCNQQGESYLIAAVKCNRLDIMHALLNSKANVDQFDKAGRNALMWAVTKGSLVMVTALLNKGAGIDEMCEHYCRTPLMWAAEEGQLEILKKLIEYNADVDKFDSRWPRTALMYAVQKGFLDIVMVLRDQADLDIANSQAETALMLAAKAGRLDIVNALVEVGAKINLVDKRGNSALLWAIREKHLAAAKALVVAKADLDQADGNGKTSLMLSVMMEERDLVELLVKAGANLDLADTNGRTALMWAADAGSLDIVNILVQAGAEVGLVDGMGRNALMYAIKRSGKAEEEERADSEAIVEALVQAKGAGQDINRPVDNSAAS